MLLSLTLVLCTANVKIEVNIRCCPESVSLIGSSKPTSRAEINRRSKALYPLKALNAAQLGPVFLFVTIEELHRTIKDSLLLFLTSNTMTIL